MEVRKASRKKSPVRTRRVGSGRKAGRGVQAIRLLKLAEVLRAPGARLTLKELAKQQNVTVRTIRRDIKTLAESGVQIIKFGSYLHATDGKVSRNEVALDLIRHIMNESPSPRLALAYAWLQDKPVAPALIEGAMKQVVSFDPLHKKLKALTQKVPTVHAHAA